MSSLRARMEALVGPVMDTADHEDQDQDETTKAKLDKAFKDSDEDEDDDNDFDDEVTNRRSELRTRNAPSLADVDDRCGILVLDIVKY